jgi:molybdate transport system ATP-binding protein
MNGVCVDIGLQRDGFLLNARLQVPANGITALLGASGSGKTTVLRAIAGLEYPQRGTISSNEVTWFDAKAGICLTPQQRRVGLVFQDYALFPNKKVRQNIEYGIKRSRRQKLASEWLERMHLTTVADQYPHQLSGGQRQRVALARALAHEPDILLLDEPFSAVDFNLRHYLRQQLREAMAGVDRPVMMVTHDLDDVRQLASTVGIMDDGELMTYGDVEAVMANPGNYKVAQVLGWQNFLPVSIIKQSQVSGPWGSVEFATEPSVDTAWVGIRPEHVRMAVGSDHGFDATVHRITDMGAIRVVECRLADGTVVYCHRPWEEVLPSTGVAIKLHLPSQHLRALPERGYAAALPIGGCGSKSTGGRPDQQRRIA